jgi:hypothetical protein
VTAAVDLATWPQQCDDEQCGERRVVEGPVAEPRPLRTEDDWPRAAWSRALASNA